MCSLPEVSLAVSVDISIVLSSPFLSFLLLSLVGCESHLTSSYFQTLCFSGPGYLFGSVCGCHFSVEHFHPFEKRFCNLFLFDILILRSLKHLYADINLWVSWRLTSASAFLISSSLVLPLLCPGVFMENLALCSNSLCCWWMVACSHVSHTRRHLSGCQ